jgi:hypothetical protein
MKLSKMAMDSSIAAKNKCGRDIRGIEKIILKKYFCATASEAVDDFGRHVRVEQRSCNHLECAIRLN